jgi:Membrane bound O-acyl transferase family
MALTPTQCGLLSHLAAIGLLFSALFIHPSKLSHKTLALAFLPPIWACHIYSWSVGLGFLAAVQVLWATELLLFQNPREKFQVIYHQKPSFSPPLKPTSETASKNDEKSEHDDKKECIWKEPYPTDLFQRFFWVCKLHISMRYIGWDTNSSATSQPISSLLNRKPSRFRWLLNNILLAGICFLLIDVTNLFHHLDIYFQVETPIDKQFPSSLAALLSRYTFGFLPPPRLVRILVLGLQQYAVFTLINRALAILHVSLGGLGLLDEWWGGVESWPMLMGSPAVVWRSGLRGFWGRFWHQLFRNVSLHPSSN